MVLYVGIVCGIPRAFSACCLEPRERAAAPKLGKASVGHPPDRDMSTRQTVFNHDETWTNLHRLGSAG